MRLMDLQYFFVIIFLCLGIKVLIQASFRNKLPLPPSPLALPIIGHIHLLGPIAHQALHKLSIRYGPLMYLFVGSIPNLIVSSAEMANEILKSNELNFMNRPTMQNVDFLTYGSADFFSAPYGLHWKFMKKICMTELFSSRALDSFASVRSEELKKLLIRVLKKGEAKESVNFGEQLKLLTSNIIARMMFRERQSDSDGEREEVIKMVVELNEVAGFFNVSETFWFLRRLDLQGLKKRLKNARDKYDVIIERIMEEHDSRTTKDSGPRKMLDILLDIYKDSNAEIKLTRENIKAFIMNIYGGGTDTSAITVEWALAELINHPEIMKKARQEIEQVVGNKRVVQESDLCYLTYVQAIVKETIRLHPGGPIFVRESNEECVVAGYRIPAKTRVIFNVWSIGRDSNQWEDPSEFRPERFEGSEWKVMREKMVSFGGGRRSCPGEKMVFRFVPIVLAAIIQCFELEVKGSVEMNEGTGSSLPRATMQNVDFLTYGSADFFSAPYGLHWKFMKKICMTELFSSRALDSFASVRSEELKKLLIRVLKKGEAKESVNFGEQLKLLTSNIIARMMFRERQSDSDGEREEVIKMVVELNEVAGFFNVSETFWFLRRLDLQGLKKRLKNARDKYDVIIERIMEEHDSRTTKDSGVRKMLDILLDS